MCCSARTTSWRSGRGRSWRCGTRRRRLRSGRWRSPPTRGRRADDGGSAPRSRRPARALRGPERLSSRLGGRAAGYMLARRLDREAEYPGRQERGGAMESELSRRTFIQQVGTTLAATPLMFSKTYAASDVVNLAVVGTGGRGTSLLKRLAEVGGARVVAVCDLDPERLNKAAHLVEQRHPVQSYADHRKLLENKDINAVIVATPDHWHTPIALSALLAGKDVYVEKPCSHNIQEANLLVKCAREHNRCVQHGTQRRSSAVDMAGVRALQEGLIGDVYVAKAINHQLRGKIGKAPAEAAPAGVNYDLWLGAAPLRAFTRNRWHYNWHWFWEYGGGDFVNDGIHQLDVAVWGLGLDLQYPQEVVTSGGQLWYDDDHETPDTQTVIYAYPGKQIVYEMRLWTDYKLEGHDNGTIFYGTKGKMEIGRGGAVATTLDGKVTAIRPADYGIQAEDILTNFVAAVRQGDPLKLNSPIDRGAVSTNLCHLGSIGVRCGGIKLAYDPKTATISSAAEANRANALIVREYRKGYELPYSS
ncbi:MAG: gfo/Idh/MocA family oxidoreductase [Luteitalea sp.]|nr:gfo/Idh/MocA family oxidoreductase [Luteitalea sp.]